MKLTKIADLEIRDSGTALFAEYLLFLLPQNFKVNLKQILTILAKARIYMEISFQPLCSDQAYADITYLTVRVDAV